MGTSMLFLYDKARCLAIGLRALFGLGAVTGPDQTMGLGKDKEKLRDRVWHARACVLLLLFVGFVTPCPVAIEPQYILSFIILTFVSGTF